MPVGLGSSSVKATIFVNLFQPFVASYADFFPAGTVNVADQTLRDARHQLGRDFISLLVFEFYFTQILLGFYSNLAAKLLILFKIQSKIPSKLLNNFILTFRLLMSGKEALMNRI